MSMIRESLSRLHCKGGIRQLGALAELCAVVVSSARTNNQETLAFALGFCDSFAMIFWCMPALLARNYS